MNTIIQRVADWLVIVTLGTEDRDGKMYVPE
jgi:hypothetical protein